MNPKRLLGAFVVLSASTITQAATPITIGEMVKIPSKPDRLREKLGKK